MNIRVKITRDGSNLIKTIDLEEYLRGVVPSEMYSSWHLEALKSQAVAARTYAMKKIQDRKSKEFDVDDTTAFQAYREDRKATSTDKAVKLTKNQYLTYNGKIIDAVYSSSNGGKTYSAEERWGGKINYLISQPDPYNKDKKTGHGVGLSQVGAKYRAEDGITYDKILAFYYPGTVLENAIKSEPKPEPVFKPYKVKVTASALNYRSGPSTQHRINGVIRDKGIYTIIEEKDGWGKLQSGAGWISLKYAEKYELAPAPIYKTYTVKKGDTLWGISEKYLGKGTRYKEIMTLNNLKSDVINVGTVLKIPEK